MPIEGFNPKVAQMLLLCFTERERGRIIQLLYRFHRLKIKTLVAKLNSEREAFSLEYDPLRVREHLFEMENYGLVTSTDQKVYRLSEVGLILTRKLTEFGNKELAKQRLLNRNDRKKFQKGRKVGKRSLTNAKGS